MTLTTAAAPAQDFLLGIDYSEATPTGSLSYANSSSVYTDAQGNIYLLTSGGLSQQTSTITSYLTKLNPSGNQVVYQTVLAFQVSAMAVDAAGDIYLAGSNFVEKLDSNGTTAVYKTVIGGANMSIYAIALDSSGRAYLTGALRAGDLSATPGAFQQTAYNGSFPGFVVRLTAAGGIDYATYLGGSILDQPTGIAADITGSAFVTGFTESADFPITQGTYLTSANLTYNMGASFLMRLSPDGSKLVYSTFAGGPGTSACCVALDSSDNAVIARSGWAGYPPGTQVMRFNPQGTAVLFSTYFPSGPTTIAVDANGYTYVAGVSTTPDYAVSNSLAPCEASQSAVLAVLDTSGNILQSTYIPGGQLVWLALAPDSTVYLAGLPAPDYASTRQLAGAAGGLAFLTQLSTNAKAQPIQLACIGNAASYDSSAVSPGELVSLFGSGLGPVMGTEPQVTVATGFPKQLAGVQVTFNGAPAPLLYVQNGQINTIAPWSLGGQTANVCVIFNGVTTNCLSRPLQTVHPGVFTVDGLYAVALNQDGSINSASHPAPVTSTVSIFATGLGPLIPQQPDGSIVGPPLPTNEFTPQMDWTFGMPVIGPSGGPLMVSYVGPAPGEVAGISQINFGAFSPYLNYVQFPMPSGDFQTQMFKIHIAQ